MTSPARAPRPTPRREGETPKARRRDHLTVVPPPGRPTPRTRTGSRVFTAIVVMFGSLLTAAVLHGMLASGQAHLNELDADIRSERIAVAQERLALADLQAPGRIATEAARIGMVPADGQVWLSPAANGDTVDTGPAAPDAEADTDPVADGQPTELAGPTSPGAAE